MVTTEYTTIKNSYLPDQVTEDEKYAHVAFPDFLKPITADWWKSQIHNFHDELEFDGLWIDMNEPSNFRASGSVNGCPTSKYEDPPFRPSKKRLLETLNKTVLLCYACNYCGTIFQNVYS